VLVLVVSVTFSARAVPVPRREREREKARSKGDRVRILGKIRGIRRLCDYYWRHTPDGGLSSFLDHVTVGNQGTYS